MIPSGPSALPLLRRLLLALAAIALVLTGCISPGETMSPTLTAIIIQEEGTRPSMGATDTAVVDSAGPIGTETPSTPPNDSAADVIPTATPGPRPTRTPLPPYPTPAVFNCAEELDLTRADFNQMFLNMKAELESRNQELVDLLAPFYTLEALHPDVTPVVDPTQVARIRATEERWSEAAHLQPCRLTGLWVSSSGWIAARISQDPPREDARRKLPTPSYPAWLVLYHLSTLRPAWVADYPQGLLNLRWSPSGEHAAIIGGDQVIHIRGTADGTILTSLPAPQPLVSRCDVGYPENNFAWDAEGQRILRKTPGKIETWDVQTAALVGEIPFDDSAASPAVAAGDTVCFVYASWSPGARYLITNDFGARSSAAVIREMEPPQIWDTHTGMLVRTLAKEYSNIVSNPLWSSTDLLYQYLDNGALRITSALTGEQFDQQNLPWGDWIDSTAWSPDGTKIASSGIQRLTLYDTGTKTMAYYDYPEEIWDPNFIAWLPDSAQVMVVFNQNFEPQTVYLYDMRTGQLSGPGMP